jgi:hypothetical protein
MIIVYILLAIIAAVLLIAYLMPGAYNVEKSTVIKKPQSLVMSNVGNLAGYRDWNPWMKMEPSATSTITGSAHTPGHKYAWEGKKIGVGSLTLTDIDEKHIHFTLEFLKPFKSKAQDNWLFEQWGDGSETKVTWQNSGALPWPIARLMGPMITKNLNRQFVEGLENLKKMCEG